jgi:Tfp pilus assembly protein PilX
MALGITVVLAILAFSMISYTTANKSSAQKSSGDLLAAQYAESGLNAAYSMIYNQNTTQGNPAAANLMGCNGVGGATDPNGPSDCSGVTSATMKLVCIAAGTCSSGQSGTASFYGYFSGTNATASFTGPGVSGVAVPASTWLIVSTGYARNSNGAIVKKSTTATVKISALDSGAVASVWNHMFVTSPLVANQCSVDFGGNNMSIVDPLYVIGNLCFSGGGVSIYETAGGQPVDLQVGGKLVLSGSGTKVGLDSGHPITSGVVAGGCTTISVSSTTSSCSSGSFNYWVGSLDTFVPADAPELQPGDAATDYANFDPGPKHTCQTGVTSPGAPLADSAFDSTVSTSGEPDRSGSTTANTSFELAPNFSYSCISKNGASVGEITWNNSTSTVNGIPGKTLKINGSIFFDSNLTISQTASYTGTAIIEVAGTIVFNGNATQLCATKPCDVTTANVWQGSSSNKSMLTLASILSNATPAVQFTDNSQTFQGSIWCQPSSTMNFVKNGVTIQGPISIGKFDASFNNAVFKPLPVIKNMPVGAPVPPNTSASIGALTVTK